MASIHDCKETRSTTPRLGPAVPPGLILNTILEIIREIGNSYVTMSGLGSIVTYPPRAMAAVNRNKAGAPFQHAGSPFAVLAVVKSMAGLLYRHLQGLEDGNNNQTQLHGSSDPSHSNTSPRRA